MGEFRVAVIGAGMFGYPMADYIAGLHKEQLTLFDVDKNVIEHLKNKKFHPTHFSDLKLNSLILATTNLKEALSNKNLIILALPSSCVRKAIFELKPYIEKNSIILNLSKGLEPGTDKRISQIISEEISHLNCEIASLSGGMIASEFVKHQPLFATIASNNKKTAKKLADFLSSYRLHLDVSKDLTGVELAGPLKNIIAIASGILVGEEHTPSSVAGFLTRASHEAKIIATKMGSRRYTFSTSSSAWAGDLIATCFGDSRNKEFGIRIGKGQSVSAALEEMKKENKLVEGYTTIKAVHEIINKNKLDCPLLKQLYKILYEDATPTTLLKKEESL